MTIEFTYSLVMFSRYVTLFVTGEYTEGELGTREDGFQVEPDYGPVFKIETVEGHDGTRYTKEDLPEHWSLIEDRGYEVANNQDKPEDDREYYVDNFDADEYRGTPGDTFDQFGPG